MYMSYEVRNFKYYIILKWITELLNWIPSQDLYKACRLARFLMDTFLSLFESASLCFMKWKAGIILLTNNGVK